jgi:hypothetical protein
MSNLSYTSFKNNKSVVCDAAGNELAVVTSRNWTSNPRSGGVKRGVKYKATLASGLAVGPADSFQRLLSMIENETKQ